jgi:hypothetical protein
MGLVFALAGAFPTTSWAPVLRFFLAVVSVGAAQLAISWWTATRDPRILWAGLLVPLLFTTFFLAILAGVVDVGGVGASLDASIEMAQASTVLLINAVAALGYALALRAYYANRHRPGFSGQAMPKT